MEVDYPLITVPATPEYVLSVIQDQHRQQCQFDPAAESSENLSFDTTVADWRNACDLVSWGNLGRALNEEWKIQCTHAQWRNTLNPPKKRTLGHVCHLIAGYASRELARPANLLGAPCATAGVFLTVRSLLANAGADPEYITPSASLAPFARRYLPIFLGPISRLAPGKLPAVIVQTPAYRVMGCGYAISLLATFVGAWLSPWVVIIAVPAALFFWIGMWVASRLRPESVNFGELRTFRDLANVLALQDETTQSAH